MSHKKIKAFAGSVAILAALSFSGTAFASFEGFGTDIPLDRAAREIAPSEITIDYGEGVDKTATVSWSSASDWQSALRSAVGKRGYTASFGTNSVVISKGASATSASSSRTYSSASKSSSASSAPRASKPSSPAKRAPAPRTDAAEAPMQGGGGFTIRPYKGGKPVEDAKTDAGKPADGRLATKGENFEPYKPAAASQFSVSAGQMLHPVLAEWASKSGWTVIWETEYDYRIEANASFNGNFVDAVTQIVTAMAEARPAITVDFYQGNNVAVVSNKSADATN